uniref:tRNA (34-2'-O)-methyltransferase regulator WDR6 n=1 Tax=Parastrongyloides trichosuri TaxID=131310 RepID=A0A0N4ZQP1_PARTI
MVMHITGPRLCSYKQNADTLLVGNASTISVYKKVVNDEGNNYNNKWDLQQQIPVFVERGYNVHGIFEIDNYLIVYGEKAIGILKDNRILKIRYYRDWILSAFCIGKLEVILHFSTNSITILNIIEEDIVTFKTKLSSSLNFSTLALSSIFVQSSDDKEYHLYVGTCFGPILKFLPLNSLNIVGKYEGHHGMVFGMNIVNNKLYSIGDDRSFRCWDIDSKKEISCSYGHEFRPFSIAYCKEFDYHLTAGGDEMICIWKWYDNDIKPKLIQKLSIKGGTIYSMICFDKQLFLGTYHGGLMKLSLSSNVLRDSIEIIVFEDEKIKFRGFNYGYDINDFVIVNSNGEVLLYNQKTGIFNILLINKDIRSDSLFISGSRKVVSICTKNEVFFINITGKGIYKENTKNTIISSIWNDNCFFLSLVDGIIIVYNFSSSPPKKYFIKMKPPTQITSALIIPNTSYIFIGQKNGCFFYIDCSDEKEIYEPKEIHIYAHGKEAILDIYINSDKASHIIYTTGRDGLVKTWFFNPTSSTKDKYLTPRTVITSMLEWPHRIYSFYGELYVGGFHAKYFQLYHLVTKTKICEFECGGGHRAWNARFINDKTPYFEFVYISKGSLNRVKLNCNFVTILDYHLHTLQITTISMLSSTHYLTGSVDTNLVLSEMCNTNNNVPKRLKVLQRMNQHISTLYDIKCIKEEDDEGIITTYVISTGGKGEIIFWKCKNNEEPIFLSHYSTFKFDEDLRVLAIQVMFNETITKDIKAIPLISILSDGSIKLIEWNIREGNAILLNTYIEDVHWMFSKLDKINNNSFASIGTDGNLYIFEITSNNKINKKKTIFIERAGLSSLAAYNNSLICVGSESGTLHIIYQGSKVTEIRYHASTLTGITVVDTNKLYHIFSVSLDCRIGHYIFNSGFGSVGFENGKVLSISDPSNIIFNKKTLISIGAGVEYTDIGYFIKDFVKK